MPLKVRNFRPVFGKTFPLKSESLNPTSGEADRFSVFGIGVIDMSQQLDRDKARRAAKAAVHTSEEDATMSNASEITATFKPARDMNEASFWQQWRDSWLNRNSGEKP